jgi:uncharacterized protein (TIGR02452 family)
MKPAGRSAKGKERKDAARLVGEDTQRRLDSGHASIAATVCYDPTALKRLARGGGRGGGDWTPESDVEAADGAAATVGSLAGAFTEKGACFACGDIGHKVAKCPSARRAAAATSSLRGVGCRVAVVVRDTVGACSQLVDEGKAPCALNFASAKNPGGGFARGSKGSQEESLCRSSGLFPCLSTFDSGRAFYDPARADPNDGLYHTAALFSPCVPVLKDSAGALLTRPFEASFVTVPAPNAGVARAKGRSEGDIARALGERVEAVFDVAVHQAQRHLVLGAFGCGCFKNDARSVAAAFRRALELPRFRGQFDTVTFAVIEEQHLAIFGKAFEVSSDGGQWLAV